MEDSVSYKIDKSEINRQKMHLTVINRRPQYLHKPQDTVKKDVEKQLFGIFKKYVQKY